MYSSSRQSSSRSSDRPARTFDRSGGSDRPARTFDRSGGSDRPARTFDRSGGSDRPARTFDRSGGSDRPARTFDRKPYAGKPTADRGSSRTSDRGLDPRQMRYQVIGRTTDESDLIVQISPAFYEYVRSMAHQGIKAPKMDHEKPGYSKFDHPFHKDPLHTSYDKSDKRSSRDVVKKQSSSWDDEDIDVDAIDAEMDDEYQMIKQGFAKLKENTKTRGGKNTTPKTNKRKS